MAVVYNSNNLWYYKCLVNNAIERKLYLKYHD